MPDKTSSRTVRRSSRRPRRVLAVSAAVIAAASLGLSACSSFGKGGSSKGAYVIGMTAALTGANAPLGNGLLGGLKAAFNAANAAGGINGRQIKINAMDDKLDPSLAATQARNLVNGQKAIAIAGIYDAYTTVVPITQQLKIPTVAQGFLNQHLDTSKFQYVFPGSTNPVDEMNLEANYLETLAGSLGHTPRVAVVYLNTVLGQAINTRAKAQVQAHGWTLATDQQVELTGTNIAPQVASVVGSKPDFVMAMSSGTAEAGLFRGLRQSGFQGPIVNYAGGSSAQSLAALNDPNLFGLSAYHYPDETQYQGIQKFLADTKAAGVDPSASYVQNGYSQGLLIVNALKVCGSKCTSASLTDALNHTSNFTADDFYATPANTTSSQHYTFLGAEVVHYVGGKVVPVTTIHEQS